VKKGFEDGLYAAVPYGDKHLIVIFNGLQLEMVSTQAQAKKLIANHKNGTEANLMSDEEPKLKKVPKVSKSKNDTRNKRIPKAASDRTVGRRPDKNQNRTPTKRVQKNKLS
jgi:hypothetical protein